MLTYAFLIFTCFILSLFSWSLYSFLNQRFLALQLMCFFLLWGGVSLYAAGSGHLLGQALPPPLFFLVMPSVCVLVGWGFQKSIAILLQSSSPATWIGFQSFRLPVELFLWGFYLQGVLPVQMSFHGQNWDVVTGITAPFVAYLSWKGKASKLFLRLWNYMGIGLLLKIVLISIFSLPSPWRYYWNEPANTLVLNTPVVLLPALLVPFALLLHLMSLRQLKYLS